MKKAAISLVIFALFTALIFSSGCLTVATGEKTNQGILGADRGLELSFLANSPPSSLFPNNPFLIVLQMENKGEYDIKPSETIIVLAGLNPNLFNLDQNPVYMGDGIQGVKQYGTSVAPGETKREEFESTKGYTGPLAGDTVFTAIAKVCYTYRTSAESVACIKSLRASDVGGVCQITAPKSVSNKGAPVKVTKVEQLPLGQPETNKVTMGFNINVKNVGLGRPYISPLGNCASITYTDLDRVEIESIYLDDTPFRIEKCDRLKEYNQQSSCCWFNENTKSVQLIDGEGTLICQITTDSSIEYVGALSINLKYNYADQVSRTITLRKIGV